MFFRRTSTRSLTSTDLSLDAGQRKRQRLAIVFGLALVALAGVASVRYLGLQADERDRLAALEAENRELREALGNAKTELEVELATRSELERQLAALTEQLRQARDELAFIKSAGASGKGS